MSAYDGWTNQQLIARILELENTATVGQTPVSVAPGEIKKKQEKKKAPKGFDFNSYSRRKIALKFCYEGWHYSGLAVQGDQTPLPTVEAVLFDTMAKVRLIDPAAGFEGCGWSRCGRTDCGVSAAGQVVALWVRSALKQGTQDESTTKTEDLANEIEYLNVLNRNLPPSIRILAWSPVSSDFSARFNCRRRHYKYFFNSTPPPSAPLDIARMQDAASRLVGENDFRNFCKINASKQIDKFDRFVESASITPLGNNDGSPFFVFDLVGSAFLWHQVRHIMAILFMVGQRLEEPSVVDALLNASPERTNPLVPRVESRPAYEIAEGLPLVLWDCKFDDGDVRWIGSNEPDKKSTNRTSMALVEELSASHTEHYIKASIIRQFMNTASSFHEPPAKEDGKLTRINTGAGNMRYTSRYVKLLDRKRLATAAEVNEQWRIRKGLQSEQREDDAP